MGKRRSSFRRIRQLVRQDRSIFWLTHDLAAIQTGTTENQLSDGLRSLALVLDYFGGLPGLKGCMHLLDPMYAVLRELSDIAAGSPPGPLLQPKKTKRHDRVAVSSLKATAAACMEHLMKSGHPRLESARLVADELNHRKIQYPYADKSDKGISPERVNQWRSRVRTRPAEFPTYKRLLIELGKSVRAYPRGKNYPAGSATERVAQCIQALTKSFPMLQIAPV